VRPNLLRQLYSSKTEDELLALAAEQHLLVEEARAALGDELRRRNLSDVYSSANIAEVADTSQLASDSSVKVRAKWVGLWLLNTLVATLGIAVTVGLLTYSTQTFVTRATRIRLLFTPYYPLPIMVSLAVGSLSYIRFKGSYRYWAWIAPALLVLASLLDWKNGNQAPWAEAIRHFFGPVPYPENRDQLDTSVVLYMATAYSLGAFIQDKLQGGVSRQ
jgi:hypothetical protein